MGWFNAILNLGLAFIVAYAPLVPISFIMSFGNPLQGPTTATFLGGIWFLIVFVVSSFVVLYRYRLLGEKEPDATMDNMGKFRGQTISIYAKTTLYVMWAVCLIAILTIVVTGSELGRY